MLASEALDQFDNAVGVARAAAYPVEPNRRWLTAVVRIGADRRSLLSVSGHAMDKLALFVSRFPLTMILCVDRLGVIFVALAMEESVLYRFCQRLDDYNNRMKLHRTKTINTMWAIVLLLVAPSRLIAHSVDHALRSLPAATSPERMGKLRESHEKQFIDSILLLRTTLFTAFAVVAGAILAAYLSGAALNAFTIVKSPEWNAWLQYGGIGILLWATLGRVDSSIQTFDGNTLPERVDLWLYRWLYVIGSYALALSVAW